MSETVLVTGGDGFLGANLVRELCRRGYTVRVFSEPGRTTATLGGMPVEFRSGDIRRPQDVKSAVEGSDYIIHAAASTSIWPSRSRLLEEINVGGTRNVIDAALSCGVRRLVHIGTANSFGSGTRGEPGSEQRPYSGTRYRLGYIETKREAHRLVFDAVERRGLRAVVVAPTFMIGPYDTKPGSGQLILAVVDRKLPGFARGGRNYVYVKDVASAAANALKKGRIGESYILGNENLTYREFFSLVAAVACVAAPRVQFPKFVVLLTGFFGSLYGAVTGRRPTVTLPVARISVDTHFYSAEKAVRELDLPQTPIETAIEDALAWFRDNGYIGNR